MFTQNQILEIQAKLALLGVKDSALPTAITPLNSNEELAIIQNGNNVRLKVIDLFNQLSNNKGYFTSLDSLIYYYPEPLSSDVAYVYDISSSTLYYVAIVNNGTWELTATEAPGTNISLEGYALHGYNNPLDIKTLKQVDDEKIPYYSIVQTTGTSTTTIMSQKATTDAINNFIIEGNDLVTTDILNTTLLDYVTNTTHISDINTIYEALDLKASIEYVDTALSGKVSIEAGSRLINTTEIDIVADAVTNLTLQPLLDDKVSIVEGYRMVSEAEIAKLDTAIDQTILDTTLEGYVPAEMGKSLISTAELELVNSAVQPSDLSGHSKKSTVELEESLETPEGNTNFIKYYDETNEMEKKVSFQTLIPTLTTTFTTAKTLVGEKDGINNVFRSDYTYVEGSERLNINGSIYYPNSGFYYEGESIILSGAPVPEAADFMFLEAIYTK